METAFRRAPHSGGRRTLFLVTLIAILVVLANVATGGGVAALVRDAVAPVSNLGGRMGNAITHSGFFSTRGQLEAQIAALQAQVQQGQLQAAAFEAVQQENTSLSQLTHLAQSTQGLAAPITSSLVSSPYGTFTIGAGSDDGVAAGSLVLTADGFVIGKVTQAQAQQSLVEEVFAPNMQTPVSVDGAAVVATGEGGAAQTQVPHGVTVSEGDPVIAPEYGNRDIGIVQHVDSDPANAEQAVYIALPVSLSSLQFVYVTP